MIAVLAGPLLALAGLFADIWQRFPDIFPDKPDGHLAFGILTALCVVGAESECWPATSSKPSHLLGLACTCWP
ncbi:hypothetical protein JOF56_009302 [Kibdelosporangium banguiense]|uniref:Uncharacterized protein n=1 Tax=Kibdelosporangium banguiense TaxID=1365924 RepID=A0ABS4TWZ3_9PSEU|nr:hypothetical protein [Kibdelosporangium banguiense]MBP2328917.1 hypothetical protein [Kibdelosporangium banguiense]